MRGDDPVTRAGLLGITVGALASMVVRYRRTGPVERKQITWLLYAVSLFALVYAPLIFLHDRLHGAVIDAALVLSLVLIPVAMAIAILRYRLFDIDVVVRRTVTFAVVTVLLALTYLAGVLVFSLLTGVLTGIDSAVGVAASTLLVVGLFHPIRRRTQAAVERWLFRTPYDRGRIVTAFSRQLGQETDITVVTGNLLNAVTGTLHPSTVAAWVRGHQDADGPTVDQAPVLPPAGSRSA